MPYILFHDYFPKLAEAETRTITVSSTSDPGLPAGEYAFLEMFCDERGCDCRRVFFSVVSSSQMVTLAVVAYGWESSDFYAKWMHDDNPKMIAELKGPILNQCSPQSRLAPAILNLVQQVLLQDATYIDRLKRHYQLFREKVDGVKPTKSKKKKQEPGRA